MKKIVKLTERDLHNIIDESVRTALQESAMNEGMWNNLKAGANAFFGKGAGDASQRHNAPNDTEFNYNLGARWNAAKTNYQEQGKLDKKQELIQTLEQYLQRFGSNVKLRDVITSLKRSIGANMAKQSYSINQIYR